VGANVEARIAAMPSETPPRPEFPAPVGDGPAADALRQLDQALAMLSQPFVQTLEIGIVRDQVFAGVDFGLRGKIANEPGRDPSGRLAEAESPTLVRHAQARARA
jgi:hypothetical protein